jgi:hypothetical protein
MSHLQIQAVHASPFKMLASTLQSSYASSKTKHEGVVAMKLQNILWVPVVAIGLGVASLSSPVTAQQEARTAQVRADQQPKVTEAVLTGVTDEGADVAATGESFATVALFTPGATAQAESARQALIGALMAAILMGGTGLIVVYVVAATRRRERYLQPTLRAGAYTPDSGVAAR